MFYVAYFTTHRFYTFIRAVSCLPPVFSKLFAKTHVHCQSHMGSHLDNNSWPFEPPHAALSHLLGVPHVGLTPETPHSARADEFGKQCGVQHRMGLAGDVKQILIA